MQGLLVKQRGEGLRSGLREAENEEYRKEEQVATIDELPSMIFRAAKNYIMPEANTFIHQIDEEIKKSKWTGTFFSIDQRNQGGRI